MPLVILKVGTFDDPSLFGVPQMAINTLDKQPFHMIPEGLPTFERRGPAAARAPGDGVRTPPAVPPPSSAASRRRRRGERRGVRSPS